MQNPVYERLRKRALENAKEFDKTQKLLVESAHPDHATTNEEMREHLDFEAGQVADLDANQIAAEHTVNDSGEAGLHAGEPLSTSVETKDVQHEGEANIEKSNSEAQGDTSKEVKSNNKFNNAVKKSMSSAPPSVFATSSNTPPPTTKGVSPDVWAESDKEMNKQRARIKAGEQQRASEIEAIKKQHVAFVDAKENAHRSYLNAKDYANEQASIQQSNTQERAPSEDKGLSI